MPKTKKTIEEILENTPEAAEIAEPTPETIPTPEPTIVVEEVKPIVSEPTPIAEIPAIKKNCVCTSCKQGQAAVGILKMPQ